ncbi:hypothetical protein MD588_23195 [Photobacterium sp. SDRW27]|uniref:hypothetical protein n=1 Tax=Photobacterium obscurum TaxID=2829490 RepID=UPI002243CD77|nr:hypothetical protein [Photobacterium obscurum]MCW8331710.1 hypothetical protein [Photobacterium obscurum]
MRIIFFFLTNLLLLGCSSGISVNVPEKFESAVKQDSGYLAGSLSTTTVWPSSGEGLVTTLYIRQSGDEDAITIINDNSHADFITDSVKGQLFSLALPPGEYELFCIGFKGSNGNRTIRSKSKEDLGLTFTVESGKVTYIGQFIASSLVAKSKLWNTEYPSGYGYITHNYANQRDKALFDERHPALSDLTFMPEKLGEINNRLISTSH